MEEVLVPAIVFLSIFGTVVLLSFFKQRRLERTALIAAGKDASIFNQGEKKPQVHYALKYGIVCFLMGVGLLVGDYLSKNTNLNEGVAYSSMLLLFGGCGLLLFYFIQKQLSSKEE